MGVDKGCPVRRVAHAGGIGKDNLSAGGEQTKNIVDR